MHVLGRSAASSLLIQLESFAIVELSPIFRPSDDEVIRAISSVMGPLDNSDGSCLRKHLHRKLRQQFAPTIVEVDQRAECRVHFDTHLDDLIERVAKRLKEVIDYRFFSLFLR